MHRLCFQRIKLIATCGFAALAVSACATDDGGSSPSVQPVAPYCPHLPSRTFETPVTVSGKAFYEYRYLGNGKKADGSFYFKASESGTPPYTLEIDGNTVTVNSLTPASVPSDMKDAIENDPTISALVSATVVETYFATGYTSNGTPSQAIRLTSKSNTQYPVVESVTGNFVRDGGNPNPIRHAEIRVSNANGELVQCAETDAAGGFSFQLPENSGSYTVTLAARSNNSFNTVYVLNNPTANEFHKISTTVSTTSSTSDLVLMASASDSLEGGAFNILDQMLNAQSYLRIHTENCNTPSDPNYFAGCTPYTVAPLVHVYWTPGVSPGVYYGISGPISFYLNGKRQLYLLGGVNGDTEKVDMDHFDNSVIIHEYAHFLEDVFGSPNSPGGSHNGNSIIDPRLAWGEGWANFFQAAVLDQPIYRDSYGHVDCSPHPCTGAPFTVDLDPSGTPTMDGPATGPSGEHGEGNFREFSVTRLLWDAIKPSGAGSKFSEIWSSIAGAYGLKTSSDQFKSIGRFHSIQNMAAGRTDWTGIRSDEMHQATPKDFANPLQTGVSCSPISMKVRKSIYDDGSFSESDLFRNNDFYVLSHPGGGLKLSLNWTANGSSDLDLYIYKVGYTYGASSSILAASYTESNSSSGTETIQTYLPAGVYMVNVMAYTGLYCSMFTCGTTASRDVLYSLTLNDSPLCPEF